MQTLRDIMTPDPLELDADMTLREALEALSAAGVGGAPVTRGTRLVGVVSGTDILEFEATSPGVPPERTEMLELDEPDVPSAEVEVEEAPGAYYVDRWFDSDGDVWARISETDSPEWDRLEEHRVDEVMTRTIVALPPDASVAEAARRMIEDRVHRVLVLDGGDMVGVVSTWDIVKVVAGAAERDEEALGAASASPR